MSAVDREGKIQIAKQRLLKQLPPSFQHTHKRKKNIFFPSRTFVAVNGQSDWVCVSVWAAIYGSMWVEERKDTIVSMQSGYVSNIIMRLHAVHTAVASYYFIFHHFNTNILLDTCTLRSHTRFILYKYVPTDGHVSVCCIAAAIECSRRWELQLLYRCAFHSLMWARN